MVRLKRAAGVTAAALSVPFAWTTYKAQTWQPGQGLQESEVHVERSPVGRELYRWQRASRSFYNVAVCAADYKVSFWRIDNAPWSYNWNGLDEEEISRIQNQVHARSARRMYRVCERSAVTYTKAGQSIANVAFGLPPAYAIFRNLHDRAPVMDKKALHEVFRRNFNASPHDLFDDFDDVPLAAASLAQVHRAKRKETGDDVAVKVQFLDLADNVASDLLTMELIFDFIKFLFPNFFMANLAWVVDEFRRNMDQELDFENEARNGMRAGAAFRDKKRFVVPDIHWDRTTREVLTMEFIHGVKVNDKEGLRALGVQLPVVGKLVAEIFAEQIFVNGFVHGDPHPGNLLIRRRPGSPSQLHPEKPCAVEDVQLVLLDHGLYRTLDDHLRQTYAGLWVGAVLQDRALVDASATALVGPRFAELFKLVLLPTGRSHVGRRGHPSPEAMRQMRAEFAKLTSGEGGEPASGSHMSNAVPLLTEMMGLVPRDLMVVFKTQNLVRALVHELSVHDMIDRHLVTARMGALGLAPSRRTSAIAAASITKGSVHFKDDSSAPVASSSSSVQWLRDSFALIWFDFRVAAIKLALLMYLPSTPLVDSIPVVTETKA